MKVVAYSEWRQTAQLIQMLLQMMGKLKLAKMPTQPEWNHSLLTPTDRGYTTGLVPEAPSAFTVELDLAGGRVRAACTTGRNAGFRIEDTTSVRALYAAFQDMMHHIEHPASFSPVPQECFTRVPFDEQTDALHYDVAAALRYFEACTLAYNGLLGFGSPFRGKKIPPSLFWGTFDLTTILFSGAAQPYPGTGLIERTAFDEGLVEFGFWPGDEHTDAPGFFALAYPFMPEHFAAPAIGPEGAFYSPEKKEYMLPLAAVLEHRDPVAAIREFCSGAFDVLTRAAGWQNLDWLNKPL